MRPRKDDDHLSSTVLLPDPQQYALADGEVTGWKLFVKILSVQHAVYLQIWRPHPLLRDCYTLVGETFFRPEELREQEVESIYLIITCVSN